MFEINMFHYNILIIPYNTINFKPIIFFQFLKEQKFLP